MFGAGGLFGGPLFGQSTLQPGGVGSKLLANNPFAGYQVNKAEKDDSEGEDGEEEKRPPSPDTFKPNKGEDGKVPVMSLEPSPYTKLVSVYYCPSHIVARRY